MSTLVINTSSENIQLIKQLVKKIGGKVIDLNEEQLEDLLLGQMMNKVKTGKKVSKNIILKKLKSSHSK
ncbi:MAG: hypothetical protein OHK0036_16930 [Bacteroidia bacterium]